MANDDFLTLTTSQRTNPTLKPNHITLLTTSTDRLEKTRIPNSQNLLSPSLTTSQRPQGAQQLALVNLPTQPSTTPLRNPRSDARISTATTPIRPPRKPPDYRNQNFVPTQPNGNPQRIFAYPINDPLLTTKTKNNCPNATQQQPRTPPTNKHHLNQATEQASQCNPQQQPTLREGESLQQTPHYNTATRSERRSHSTANPDPMAVSNPTILWMRMREYYANSRKWTSTMEPFTDKGSPLVWTMLHPPAENRNRTYAWYRPLDEYMPWTACHNWPVKPCLVSHAMWNSRRQSDLNVATATKPRPSSWPDIIDHWQQPPSLATGKFSRVITKPNSSVNTPEKGDATTPVAIHASYGIRTNPTSLTLPINPRYSAPPGTAIYSAIMDMLFPKPTSTHGGPRTNTPEPIPFTTRFSHRPWHHPRLVRKRTIKSQKSFLHWIASIIQLKWNTAWDLLTHRNVELPDGWVRPAHTFVDRIHQSPHDNSAQQPLFLALVPSINPASPNLGAWLLVPARLIT